MRNTATCNPLNCFGQVDELTEVKSSAGLSIWRDDDGVHLKAAAYRDLAANLSNQAETNGKQPLSGQTRRRLASGQRHPNPSKTSACIQRTRVDQRAAQVRQRQPARWSAWRILPMAVRRAGQRPLPGEALAIFLTAVMSKVIFLK